MQKLASFFIAFLLLSCGKMGSPDPKALANEHNDAKFSDPRTEENSRFLVETASFYIQEIALSKLAQENSTDKSIQITGKELEKEYRELYGSARDLSSKKGISIPSEPAKKDRADDTKLSYEIAEDFDKQFLDRTIHDHRDAIAAHVKQKNAAEDPELLQFTEQSLSRIRRNFDFILLRHHDKIAKLN